MHSFHIISFLYSLLFYLQICHVECTYLVHAYCCPLLRPGLSVGGASGTLWVEVSGVHCIVQTRKADLCLGRFQNFARVIKDIKVKCQHACRLII